MVAYFSHLFTDLITRSYGYVTNIFCCSHFTAESTHLQERKLKATPLCKSSFKLLSGFHLIIYIETHSRITEVFFLFICVWVFCLFVFCYWHWSKLLCLDQKAEGAGHLIRPIPHTSTFLFRMILISNFFKKKSLFTVKYYYFPINEGLYSMKHKRWILCFLHNLFWFVADGAMAPLFRKC